MDRWSVNQRILWKQLWHTYRVNKMWSMDGNCRNTNASKWLVAIKYEGVTQTLIRHTRPPVIFSGFHYKIYVPSNHYLNSHHDSKRPQVYVYIGVQMPAQTIKQKKRMYIIYINGRRLISHPLYYQTMHMLVLRSSHVDVNQEEYRDVQSISNIRRTKSQSITVSRLVLHLSSPNLLKPCVKSKMKMQLEQRRQALLQLHLSDQQFNCPQRCALY